MSNQLIPVSDAIIARQDTDSVALLRKENISTIVQAGPQSYQTNALSCQRCTEAGRQLLDEIERTGMTDDLDRRLAAYIEKARKTVKAMNERRSPVTKLFDQVRSEFTLLENAIDPSKKDTIPYRIALYRNAYAAKKREQEERRRQEELAAQELIRAKESYRAAVEEDYRRTLNALIDGTINRLTSLNSGVTLETYTAVFEAVSDFQSPPLDDWCPLSSAPIPYNLTPEEAKTIRDEVLQKHLPAFEEQFVFEVDEYRQDILDKLPSKKIELQRLAEASAAEAARLKAEMAKREAEDAARKEQECQKAEAEAKQKAELEKSNAEMAGLFSMAKAEQVYTPKAKVSKKLKINDSSAFLAIVSMWWQREGCTLSVDELSKIFKKQVTFCEKLATKDGVFVESPALEYYDDVKAQ